MKREREREWVSSQELLLIKWTWKEPKVEFVQAIILISNFFFFFFFVSKNYKTQIADANKIKNAPYIFLSISECILLKLFKSLFEKILNFNFFLFNIWSLKWNELCSTWNTTINSRTYKTTRPNSNIYSKSTRCESTHSTCTPIR